MKSGLSPETELVSAKTSQKFLEERNGNSNSYRVKSSIIEVEQEISSVRQSYKTTSQSELSRVFLKLLRQSQDTCFRGSGFQNSIKITCGRSN